MPNEMHIAAIFIFISGVMSLVWAPSVFLGISVNALWHTNGRQKGERILCSATVILDL